MFRNLVLGNTKVFKQNPDNDFLKECVAFYNVKSNDPELMGKMPQFEGSTSVFHSSYLQKILAERNISYSKNNPQGVVENTFWKTSLAEAKKRRTLLHFNILSIFAKK